MTDQDIYTVTHKVGLLHDQLNRLYNELGLPADEVENEQKKADTKDYKLQANKVLGHWKSTNGMEATREKLIAGLREAGCIDAIEKLQEKHNW